MSQRGLTDEQISVLRDVYSEADSSGEGLSFDELNAVLRSLGLQPTDDELKEMCDGIDLNENIGFNDFLSILADQVSYIIYGL